MQEIRVPNMREIILDTESTGLDPDKGHRLIEIGCVEVFNRLPTGNVFHTYLNPERDVPEEAYRIHKISTEFLQDKPLFSHVYKDFLTFLGEDPLVIHNASFDLKFINAELHRVDENSIPLARAIDTVLIARKKFPGSPASLDALCTRFKINTTQRMKKGHGALLDAHLLVDVYNELLGGSQMRLSMEENPPSSDASSFKSLVKNLSLKKREARFYALTAQEKDAHHLFCKTLKKSLWEIYDRALWKVER